MEIKTVTCTGYPPNTVGYGDGGTLENAINRTMEKMLGAGWEWAGSNVVSATCAFVTFRRSTPRLRSDVVPIYCPGCGSLDVECTQKDLEWMKPHLKKSPVIYDLFCRECEWASEVWKYTEAS